MRRRPPPRQRRRRASEEGEDAPPRQLRRRASEEAEDAPPPSPDDRLSVLPDALLHRVLSSLKAWEVVRTCVLARRWRHLWASAPCVDLRLRHSLADADDRAPEDFPRFARRLFRRRDAAAAVDTLRLRSSDEDRAYDADDARSWIRAAVKRRARVVHLIGHRDDLAGLEHEAFVSTHLKVLKLSYARLDDNLLRQLSSRCPNLEEMDLKDCLISGTEISSSSLKTLTMVKCNMFWGLTVTAPNLVVLRCVEPIGQAPSFNNLGSLAACSIILDDLCFRNDYEDFSKDSDDGTTDDDSDDEKKWRHKIRETKWRRQTGYKGADDYGSDIESDDNTFEYSEIASDFDGSGYDDDAQSSRKDGNVQAYGENSGCGDSKISGGRNIIHSLSNATSLELLADGGEVILTRELKSCPSLSNLKTLSLGEWSMAADFDRLLLFLQCAPNLEKLFLELKLNFNVRKAMEIGVIPSGRSFACKQLRMVKIKCSKDDVRVHKLAQMFKANGVSVEKIFVRRTGSAHLRSKKTMKDLARHELKFWGDDNYFWGDC